MNYVGILDRNKTSKSTEEILDTLASYGYRDILTKGSLTISYGRRSNDDMDVFLENDSSILIGRAFDKISSSAVSKEDLGTAEFLQKIWGTYVYFDEDKHHLEIAVSLNGQLPFFYYIFPNGNILFSSEIKTIFKVLEKKPIPNWTYMCSYLLYGFNSAVMTPVLDVHELPPGCRLKITTDENFSVPKMEPFWDPLFASYGTRSLYDGRDAVEILQATLKPLIEPYQNIVVSLSGGLDSSSLMYCLSKIKRSDQKLIAQNHFHANVQSSNELVYARKVCQDTGVNLVEVDVSGFLPFSNLLGSLPMNPNKPCGAFISLNVADEIYSHFPTDGSCIFLNGHGSDHIFMRMPPKTAASDYLLGHGFRGFKGKLKELAHFYRDSLFPILMTNAASLVSYGLGRRLDKRHRSNRETLSQEVVPSWMKSCLWKHVSPAFKHPIYDHLPSRIFPGKYEQIDMLYEGLGSIQVAMDPVHRAHCPFLDEPVVEFALSFPVYELFQDGYDRYPLRKAVSDRFKTQTVWRRDKGEATGIFQLGIKKNLQDVLDLCLNGQFVQKGLIDKEGLHKTILQISSGSIDHMWPVTHLACLELFLKSWAIS